MAPIGCQNFFSPFLVTAYTRCVGRVLVVSFVMILVLSLMSPPQWRPRCPFPGRGEKRGCHKLSDLPAVASEGGRTPQARSCTNEVRKRAAFTEPRAAAEPGTKRGRLGWWG